MVSSSQSFCRCIVPALGILVVLLVVPGAPNMAQETPVAGTPPLAEGPTEQSEPIDYSRLGHPELATQLQLSDEQRLAVQRALAARAIALAAAANADRAAIMANSDRELNELLTDNQRTRLKELAIIRKLRFNFVEQKWQQVLEWFAEQANMTLVYDRLPEQTFNYRDDREYTVRESIDLLNGILLAKGFTLVRRGNLMIVADLQAGISEDLIPKITVEQLDDYGQFEMVRLMIPIGDRPAEQVVTEVTPLVGPLGKIAPLPQSKQVMVTETAGKMRAIQAIIATIPEPQKPSPPPPPPKPEQRKPEFAVHPAPGLDIPATIEMLQLLVPEAKLTADTTAQQIRAYAVASEHAAIRGTLEQMTTELPAESRPRMESFPLPSVDPKALTAQLTPIIGQGHLSIDEVNKRLLVFANPAQLAQVTAAVQTMLGQGSVTDVRDISIWPLKHADTASVAEMLKQLFPDAAIIPNAATRTVAVRCSIDLKPSITQIMEQLDKPPSVGDPPLLKTYAVQTAAKASLTSMLATLSPKGVTSWQEDGKRLLVLAPQADHEHIQQALIALSSDGSSPAEKQLHFYPIDPAQQATITTLATTMVPAGQLIWEPALRRVLVIGDETSQASFQRLVEQLGPATTSELGLQAIPLEHSDPAATLSLLTTLFPATRILADDKGNRLLIWGDETVRADIAAAVQQLDTPDRLQQQEKLATYRLPRVEGDSLFAALREKFPKMIFHGSRAEQRLIAWGSEADHLRLASVLQELQSSVTEAQRALRVYDTGRYDPGDIQDLIANMLPDVRVTVDRTSRTVLVSALLEQHAIIRDALDNLPKDDLTNRGTLKTYAVHPRNLRAAQEMIANLLPEANVEISREPPRLIVVGTADEQSRVAELLPLFSGEGLEGEQRVPQRYVVPGNTADNLQELVAESVPDARVQPDGTDRGVIVLATEAQHEEIRAIVDAFQSDAKDHETRIHPASPEAITTLVAALQQEYASQATITASTDLQHIVVRASAATHDRIKTSLAAMQTQLVATSHLVPQTYVLKSFDITSAFKSISALMAVHKDVSLSLDATNKTILAVAQPAQHELLKQLVANLESSAVRGEPTTLATYRLRDGSGASIQKSITSLFAASEHPPEVQHDPSTNQLLVIATPEQHHSIEQAIQSIQGPERLLELFQLTQNDVVTVELSIEQLFGELPASTAPQIDSNSDSQQLIVRATAEQMEKIRELLTKLGETTIQANNGNSNMRVVPLRGNVSAALRQLQVSWPNMRKNELKVVYPTDLNREDNSLPLFRPAPEAGDAPVDPIQPGGSQFYVSDDKSTDSPTEAVAVGDNPPVLVVPGKDKVTIISQDGEALDQLESLLRLLNPPPAFGASHVMVYGLRSANVVDVADILRKLFREAMPLGEGQVVVVPDSRLNALVVHASPRYHETVEQLIRVLDGYDESAEVNANKPRIIPLRFASAEKIVNILESIYKSQLSSGGGRKPIDIPSGLDEELAEVLQQLNASNAGPLLTLEVDSATNSIIALGPALLVDEIIALVERLDTHMQTDDARGVRVIPLKGLNSEALQDVLQDLLDR